MAITVAGDTEPLWIDGKTHANEGNLRTALDAADLFVGVGLFTHFKVSQRAAGANFTVDVSPGLAKLTAGAASYLVRNLATKSVDVTAAPGAGNERIDLVLLEVRDDGTNDDWRIRTLAGTPAAAPVQPATPAGTMLLATIRLTATTASVTDAIITDQRTAMHRVAEVDNRDGADGYYGGGMYPGQVAVDAESGELRTRPDGEPARGHSVMAGIAKLIAVDGVILGAVPSSAELEDIYLLCQIVNKAVTFNTNGEGRLTLPRAFPNGILGFVTLGSSNSGGVIYSRRTDGTPPALDSITLKGEFVSPTAGIGLITDTRTVGALVFGW